MYSISKMTVKTDFPFLKKFSEIIEGTNLNTNTKQLYKWRLHKLTDITKHDIDWIISNCDETFMLIAKMEISTQISYINTILSLFKYTKDLKSIKKISYKNWNRKYSLVKRSLIHEEKTGSNTISTDTIESIRDNLEKNSDDYFIVSLLTYLPSKVGNLQRVKLYNNLPPDIDNDYWLIEKSGSLIKCNNNKYQVPDILDNIVRNNLRKNNRKYLIVNKQKKPYENIHAYNVYIDRIVKRVFGKDMNLNKLRKSYR